MTATTETKTFKAKDKGRYRRDREVQLSTGCMATVHLMKDKQRSDILVEGSRCSS